MFSSRQLKENFDTNEKIIDSFKKWKDTQQQAEEHTRETFRQYEDHIRQLLTEKQRFIEQYRSLHRDYSYIQSELDRIKMRTLR